MHDRVTAFSIDVFPEDGPENEVEPVEYWGTEDDPELVGLPASIIITLEIELAPRLVREQLEPLRRKQQYVRIIRFPQLLRRRSGDEPVPAIPVLTPPTEDVASAG